MKQVISIKNILNSVALCSVLFFVISISASRASASTIVNLNPTDDTKVNKSSPATNYGKSTSVEVDGGGTYEEIYMKFDLSSLAGKNIVSAKMKVKVDNTSTSTQYYKLVSDTSWLETGINYNNRPAKSSTAFTTGTGGPSGSTQLIDMTSAVKSNLGKKFAFGIDMTTADGFGFKSKETSNVSDKPALIVEYTDIPSTPSPVISYTPTPTVSPHSVSWTTDTVSLSADDFYFIANGALFVPGRGNTPEVLVHSDPGNPGYTTLELEWKENGIPMQFYMYFKAENGTWYVSEMRTYNGIDNNSWLYYTNKAPYFRTPVNQGFVANDATLNADNNKGTLHFTNMKLLTKLKGMNPSVTISPSPVEETLSLFPIADAYVQSDTPSTNYGTKNILYSVGSPAKTMFFKFDLSATAGKPIKSAVLSTKIQNDSSDLQTINNVEDNTWVETAVNYNNKPALGSSIGSFTAGAINSTNSSDVKSAVVAHSGGLMTIAVSSTKTDNMAVYSRESADKPVLKIMFGPLETPAPYITVTPTAVPLPTGDWHSAHWSTNTVSLSADDFYIIAGGKKFSSPTTALVHSDPGNPNYTTLEIEWSDNGIPMQFYMYLKADANKWTVYEMRTYDGTLAGNWIYYKADNYFSAPIGASVGVIDRDIESGISANKIHFTHMSLSTTLKGSTYPSSPAPCPAKSKGDANCDGKVDFIDFEIWRNEFMGEDTKTDANFNYNSDQKVDFIDYEIWRQSYVEQTDVPVCITRDTCPILSQNCHYEKQTSCSCGLEVCSPSLTPTVTPPCQWCGTSCTTFRPGVACPALAPPEGYSCKQVEGQCTATIL